MQYSQISPQEAAKELLRRRTAKKSLAAFTEYLGLGFIPAPHHKLLIEHLEAVERGDITRLMVWMPPGSAKSTYTSVLFPPWFMGRNPTEPILGVSNTTELAERFSRRARNIAASGAYKNVFGFGVAEDAKSAGSWANERGGEFLAAGIGSAIAGRRARLGLIDDPIKSRQEADSDLIRGRQWEWYLNDFLTRLTPKAVQVIIQTRWHEDDLSGRILTREAARWSVLKLPMEATESDPMGRTRGERLWPEWFTEEMVDTAKRDSRTWNALYQQDPAPEEGEFFKREWFNPEAVPPPGMHIYAASDYAVTEGGGDYTEHGVFGIDFNGELHLIDWWREQAASNVWIEKQCDLILKYRPLIWFGEAGPIRRAIEPFLKRRMVERKALCRLEWITATADKVVMARAFQARCAMGGVYIPMAASWLPDVMSQLMRFPAGRYDDAITVVSLIGLGLENMRAPEIKPDTPKSMGISNAMRNDGLGWMG